MRQVIVIGAGASGMMAAITAARAGCKVIILEHTSKSGRKIEITGNGKCNYTNAVQKIEYYHSDHPEYVKEVLDAFSYEDTVLFFEELGIVPKCKNGYYYPYCGQAQAVSKALRTEAECLNVKFACNINIHEIRKSQNFEIITEGYTYIADAVVLATGSKAAAATGSDGSGYALAEQLGHRIKKPLPALVQLLSKEKELVHLAGLRCEGSVTLCEDGQSCITEEGEIQFIKNGISGIPVFQLSGRAARALEEGRQVSLKVDFLAGTGWKDSLQQLEQRRKRICNSRGTVQQFLNGLVHERAKNAFYGKLNLKGATALDKLGEETFRKLCELLTAMEFVISEPNSFEHAQVCSGGVKLSGLCPKTLESKLVKNLYFAGEMLDVDASCGGYNLQWAWASGYVAGMQAAKEEII